MKKIIHLLSLIIISRNLISQSNILTNSLNSNSLKGLSSLLSNKTPKVGGTTNQTSSGNTSKLTEQLNKLIQMKNQNQSSSNNTNSYQGLFKQASPQDLANSRMTIPTAMNNSPQSQLLSQLSSQTLSQLNINPNQNNSQQLPQNNYQQTLPFQNSSELQLFYLQQMNPQEQMSYLQKMSLTNPTLAYFYMQYLNQKKVVEPQIDEADNTAFYYRPLTRNEIDKKLGKYQEKEPVQNKDEEKEKNKINNRGSWEYNRRFNNPDETYHKFQNNINCDMCNEWPNYVCGDDGKNYINPCHAKCKDVFYSQGKCEE